MNQSELIAQVAEITGLPKKAVDDVLKIAGEVITDTLTDGGEATLPCIGKFSCKLKPARMGRNPATGEAIDIAEKRVPKFTAAKALKEAVAD